MARIESDCELHPVLGKAYMKKYKLTWITHNNVTGGFDWLSLSMLRFLEGKPDDWNSGLFVG